MDLSSFPLLSLSRLVVESSSSSPRRRALARAVDTAHTHTNPNPRAIGRSRSVAVGRGPTTRGVSRVATRRSIHRTIGPTGRSAPARDGRRRARGWVGVRTSGRSVVRTFERRTRTRTDAWTIDKNEGCDATRGSGLGGGGCRTLPSRGGVSCGFHGEWGGVCMGMGMDIVPGDGVVVWW